MGQGSVGPCAGQGPSAERPGLGRSEGGGPSPGPRDILLRAGLSASKLAASPDLLRQFVERIEKASSARLVDNGQVMRHHLVEAFDLLPKMKD